MKIFLDGEQEVDVNISSDLGFNNLLGVNLTDNGTYTGLLSQTAIWNNALTQAEVMAVHEMGPDADLTTESDVYSSASSLYAYWKMDGSMDDNSGNGFNGTSNGWVCVQEIGLSILLRQDQLGCLFLRIIINH